jgi:hypothetical protein
MEKNICRSRHDFRNEIPMPPRRRDNGEAVIAAQLRLAIWTTDDAAWRSLKDANHTASIWFQSRAK